MARRMAWGCLLFVLALFHCSQAALSQETPSPPPELSPPPPPPSPPPPSPPSPPPPSPPPSPPPPSPPPPSPPPPSPPPPSPPPPSPPPPSPPPPSPPPPPAATPSTLWGDGSNPSSRLIDFSYAGYRQGAAVPTTATNLRVNASVTAFGAKGDGVTDDTAAVLAAINATSCPAGTPCGLFFPAGRYVISSDITIGKSLVLLGAGAGSTTLYFPKSMEDLYGNTANYAAGDQSQWAFGPGLINFKAYDPISYTTSSSATLRAFVTANATRGSFSVVVSNTSRLAVGQWMRITASDQPLPHPAAGKLIAYMYGNKLVSDWSDLVGDTHVIQFLTRITAINNATRNVTFDRPLPYDLDVTNWLNVTVHSWSPTGASQDMGVSDLTMEFPLTPYPGHFMEKGYNALFISNAANCFVNNVRFLNADFSIELMKSYFCTIRNVTIDTTGSRGAWNGHHGIEVSRGRDNLVTDCVFKAPQVHDFTYGWWTTATVVRRANGTDLNIDFHRSAPYGNLVTDTWMGAATRPFASGGSSNRGPNAGSWQTFWNLRGAQPISLPPANFGPDLNFVSINSPSVVTSPYNWLKEDIPNSALVPQDLYQAMLDKRLATQASG